MFFSADAAASRTPYAANSNQSPAGGAHLPPALAETCFEIAPTSSAFPPSFPSLLTGSEGLSFASPMGFQWNRGVSPSALQDHTTPRGSSCLNSRACAPAVTRMPSPPFTLFIFFCVILGARESLKRLRHSSVVAVSTASLDARAIDSLLRVCSLYMCVRLFCSYLQ